MYPSDRRRRWLTALALCSLTASACGGDGGGGEPIDPPAATPRGTPNGAPASATIGPDGGTLSSPDGGVTLTVPAGAVASLTELTIQPITYPGGGSGPAYRFTPDGQTFAHPVTLTFSYDPSLDGLEAQGLGIALQDPEGVWRALLASSVDEAARTVSVTTPHFSDYLRVSFWKFSPRAATVGVNQTVVLTLEACVREDNAPTNEPPLVPDDLPPLVFDEDLPGLPICRPSIRSGRWSVNGVLGGNASVGSVVPGTPSNSATYSAPGAVPTPSTVAVTAAMTWEAHGVTKVFTSLVTISGGSRTVHVVGEFSATEWISDAYVLADVRDRVEFDVTGSSFEVLQFSNLTNFPTQRAAERLEPGSFLCSFTIDSPYEYLTVQHATGAREGNDDPYIYLAGHGNTAQVTLQDCNPSAPPFSLDGHEDDRSAILAYNPADPASLPNVGDETTVIGTGEAIGWVFTLKRTQ